VDAKDHRGDAVHQSLMPKKMAKLEESPDFRPFRFRIQAFTNAFQSELHRRGISDAECSAKKIRHYLWTQKFIARFNEDGKKAKSRGNHIWIISARKLPDGGWEFRDFKRRVAGVPKTAYVGVQWTWRLHLWDPHVPSDSIRAVFSAPILPSWIHWEDENDKQVLKGVPQSVNEGKHLRIIAHYVHGEQLHELEHTINLEIINYEATDGLPASGPVPQGADAISELAAEPGANIPSTANDVAPAEMDVKMASVQESVREEVVEPNRVSNLLQEIAFPYTPPVNAGLDPSQQQFFTTGQNGRIVSVSEGINQQPSQEPPQMLQMSEMQPIDGAALQAAHLRAAIEQRQQDQTKTLLLSMPGARTAVRSGHNGQASPMTAMPMQMAASLPPDSTATAQSSQIPASAFSAGAFNPTLSPALPIRPEVDSLGTEHPDPSGA
jgi:hypothetical protein